jgi:hypothetical protein
MNNTNSYSFNISILNSLYDNIHNKNIINDYVNNLYFFKWNNIIYDNVEKIKNIDKNNLIGSLLTTNVKYFLLNSSLEDSISDYVIKNSITDINIDLDNFYIFFKKELLIRNFKNTNINYNLVKINLSDEEKKIYNHFFENDKDIKKISLFLLNSEKYNFNIKNLNDIYEINEKYYNYLIKKEDSKSNPEALALVNMYKSKVLSIKDIVTNFYDNEYHCSICLDNIDKNNFSLINCGHYFCKSCLRKYINEKEDCYECPNCRNEFLINDIYVPSDNNVIHTIENSKLKKIKDIINMNDHKIIIITEFKESIKIIETLSDDVIFFTLFCKNNYLKEKNKNLFISEKRRSILFCNYDDILKYDINNVNAIIFIDYKDNTTNIYSTIKQNYVEKYMFEKNINFYF